MSKKQSSQSKLNDLVRKQTAADKCLPLLKRKSLRKPSLKHNGLQKSFSLVDKADFIAAVDGLRAKGFKASIAAIGAGFGMSPSTAREIYRRREEYVQDVNSLPLLASQAVKRKTNRNMEPIEDALLEWYAAERDLDLNVTDNRLRGTAVAIWTEMKPFFLPGQAPKQYYFSKGWLHRFKNRNGLKSFIGHGESGSVDLEVVKDRIEAIKAKLTDFKLDDIYNCDETGLFLTAMSKRTHETGPIRGKKIVRSARVSILFCSNSTGSDKRKPLVLAMHRPVGLGKAIFKTIDADFSGKGYMRQPMFIKWLRQLDDDMQEQGRRIALLIDSAPAHKDCEAIELKSITVIRLPPNTTAMTQPLDAGVIRSFKALYSSSMLEAVARVRAKKKSAIALPSNAIFWSCIARAWESVTPGCIRNCFAEVPILTFEQRSHLHWLGIESKADHIFKLQDKLVNQYGGDKEEVTKQKDINVLNYLIMNYCEGPSELISDVVHKIMALEKYRHRFIPHVEDDIIYEGDEVEKDDEDDVDYNLSLSDSSSQDSAHSEKCIEDVLESPPSSPTIHDYQEINEEESMENYLEFMNARHEIDNPHLMKRWVAVQRQLELFNEYRHLLRENQQMNEGMKELNQNNE